MHGGGRSKSERMYVKPSTSIIPRVWKLSTRGLLELQTVMAGCAGAWAGQQGQGSNLDDEVLGFLLQRPEEKVVLQRPGKAGDRLRTCSYASKIRDGHFSEESGGWRA